MYMSVIEGDYFLTVNCQHKYPHIFTKVVLQLENTNDSDQHKTNFTRYVC